MVEFAASFFFILSPSLYGKMFSFLVIFLETILMLVESNTHDFEVTLSQSPVPRGYTHMNYVSVTSECVGLCGCNLWMPDSESCTHDFEVMPS